MIQFGLNKDPARNRNVQSGGDALKFVFQSQRKMDNYRYLY